MLLNFIPFLRSNEIYSAFPSIIAVIFLLALSFFWINRRIFIRLFKKINKVTLLILIIIAIVFILVCAIWGLNFKFFNLSDREWQEFVVAKNLLLGERDALSRFPEKKVPSLILALAFRIFGLNPLVASLLNLFLATSSIFLVFILAQIVFDNEKISLASSFIYAFTPIVLVFTSLRMGDPTTVGFFLLLFVIVAILSFRYHRFSLHVLTLALFALTTHTKPEYFILIFSYIFCFVVFKEYIHFSPKEIIILIILFFLFSLPFFISNIHFREAYASGWCGSPSQTLHDGKVHSYSHFITEPLDKIIRFLANGRLSINYLIYDIPNFIKFWFSKGFSFVFLFIIFGFLLAFRKYKKESLFILSSFLSISTVYLADCIYYEARLAVSTYGPIVIFFGFAVNLFSGKISMMTKRKLPRTFIIWMIVLILLFCWYFDFHHFDLLSYKSYNDVNIVDSYNDFKDIMEHFNFSPDDSYFIVVQRSEMKILEFLGYKTNSLTDLIRTDYFQDREKFFESFSLPLDQTRTNYFIYDWHCGTLKDIENVCNFVKDNYTEKEIGQRNGYRIFLMKN